ncbi:MAG: NAD-dependent epimerase/dehydratase family protein [Thermoanaerobaculia bacterium]
MLPRQRNRSRARGEPLRAACRGVEVVFHQAALGSVARSLEDPATMIGVNVLGTANVLMAARDAGVPRLVYASSLSVYGDSSKLPKSEGEEGRPLSPYAASKQTTEQLAAVFSRCYGLQTIGLRYFNVYGPRQDPSGPYAAVIPRFFRASCLGEPLRIYGDGEQRRDFTYVADAVEANLLGAGAPEEACGGAYTVASGKQTTVNGLAQAIRRLTGDSGGEPIHDSPRPGDVRHSLADLELARRRIDYHPAYDLDEGLAACRDYYRRLFATPAAAL